MRNFNLCTKLKAIFAPLAITSDLSVRAGTITMKADCVSSNQPAPICVGPLKINRGEVQNMSTKIKYKITNLAASAIGILALVCLVNIVTSFAQVQSWGNNDNGVLGLGNGDHQSSPQTIANSGDITALNAGGAHTLALRADGTALSWGLNQYGRLCDGTETVRLSPVSIPGLSNVIALAANDRNSLLLLSDGTLRVCGNNQFGTLGNGNIGNSAENALVPQAVPGMTNVVAVAGARNFFLALKSDGTVWAWGGNEVGQLGIGGSFSTAVGTPTQVAITGVVSIAAASFNGMAIKSDRTVRVWGYNLNGQLGNGTKYDMNPPCYCETSPTQSTITDVVQIAGGSNYITALTAGGNIYSWGNNDVGQFGVGTRGFESLVPNGPAGVSDVVAIDTGGRHTVARKRNGSVWAWGFNLLGQVGDGTVGGGIPNCNCKVSPVQSNVGTGNAIISAASNNTFAAKPNPLTPVGTSVQLRGENVNVLFSNVTVGGTTTFSQIDPAVVSGGYTLPMGGSILNNQPAYEINTTAGTTGLHSVCIDGISATTEVEFNALQILHGESPNWVNRTSYRNFNRRQICALVPSFSPFVVGQGLAPTSASVTIGGRVMTANGYGIRNAAVTVTSATGAVRRTMTSSFGYYEIGELSAGESYVIRVDSKRYVFSKATRIVTASDSLEDIDFIAEL